MNFNERVQWLFRMTLLAFILASVAFLSALTAMRLAVQGREVTMPNLVGVKLAQAQQVLQGNKLGLKIEDRVYSALPVDAVVRQSPAANIRVKTTQQAHVVLSLGPQKTNVPALVNLSPRAAHIELLQRGLQSGEVSSAYLPNFPADAVVGQKPLPGGTTENSGPHVDMLVSLGSAPAQYMMPEFSGAPMAEAESRLRAAGLKIAKISPVQTLGVAAGSVVGQNPARGKLVDARSSIELTIAE